MDRNSTATNIIDVIRGKETRIKKHEIYTAVFGGQIFLGLFELWDMAS